MSAGAHSEDAGSTTDIGVSNDEALHNACDVFLFALEVLASHAERQCELIGAHNTAAEAKDGALSAHYLVGTGFLDADHDTAVSGFLAVIEAVPVERMPSGSGWDMNLAAMHDPAWVPIRVAAKELLLRLAPVVEANRAFLGAVGADPLWPVDPS